MQNIPKELQLTVFGILSPYDRSKVCSVSKLFLETALFVSMSKFPLFKELYTSNILEEKHENIAEQIIMEGDYHLIVRLKDKKLINLKLACKGSHLPLVNLMIENGADDWNEGLSGACICGHLSLVNLMIKKGANHWNNGFYGACIGGHKSMAELMIEKGADIKNMALSMACWCMACRCGFLSIVELMIEKGFTFLDWNTGLCYACKEGRQPIVELMIKKGANECGCGKSIEEHNVTQLGGHK